MSASRSKLTATLGKAIATFERHPRTVDIGTRHVEVDGTTVVRVMRDLLSFAPGVVPAELARLAAAMSRTSPCMWSQPGLAASVTACLSD